MRATSLDGCRGVFCLLVVAFHYDPAFIPRFISESFFVRESWIFVEFFFVLSGYVISLNYSKLESTKDFAKYIAKRFLRLYPLLFYTTLIFLIVQVFMNTYFVHLLNNPKTISSLLYQTLDTLTFMNSTPIFGNSLGMNYPSWSISAEMIAYFLFGIISVTKLKSRRYFLPGLISAIGLFLLFRPSIHVFDGLNLDFLRGILSFSIGVLIHLMQSKEIPFHKQFELLIPITVAASMFALNYSTGILKVFHQTVTINTVFFLSILILTRTDGIVSAMLNASPLQFVGKLSYSIYLNHALMIVIVPRIFFQVLGFEQSQTMEIGVFFLTFCLNIIYSAFTHQNIEKLGAQKLRTLFSFSRVSV